MLPTSRVEIDRRADGLPKDLFGDGGDVTLIPVDHHIQRARKLRAEAMARFIRELGAALRRTLRAMAGAASSAPGRTDDALSLIADRLQSPLTAIRCSAEILRDNPDIDAAERSRFLANLLAEEARLEALVRAMLDASSVERRRRIWRVRLEQTGLEGHERALSSS